MRIINSLLRTAAAVSVACLLYANDALAEAAPTNAELFEHIRQLRATVAEQAARINELEECYGECRAAIEKHEKSLFLIKKDEGADISGRMRKQFERMEETGIAGLHIGGGATFIGQGTAKANAAGSGGRSGTEDSRFDGSYSADVEIAKEFGDYGLAFLHLETGDGDTLDSDLSLYPHTGVNRDTDNAGDVISLTEAWYEQYMFAEQLMATAGKIDPTAYIDTNEFANDECHQFMGAMFRNAPTVDFPDNDLGARLYFSPCCFRAVDISAVYLEGDGDWEQVFDRPFVAAQVNVMPEKLLGQEEGALKGNYRVYFWYNGTDHTRITEPEKTKEPNYGLGLSFDQDLTGDLGLFQRFGWQDPRVSALEYHWSAGARLAGSHWGRSADLLAAAVGQGIPGEEQRDASEADTAQTNCEVYYSFRVNDHLTLSPDIQVIWDPDGGDGSDPIFIYGIRGQIDL